MSTISKPISSAALRPSTPPSLSPPARRSSAMSSTYNARSATSYEHFMARWIRQLHLWFVEFAGVSDGERILDVGCGTGSLTRIMLESADVKSIVGVDLADVYLESERQTIRDPRVDFKTGDATSLPFADKSFDRAFAMLVLHFVPDAKKAVGEMRRVVRLGGVVALLSGMVSVEYRPKGFLGCRCNPRGRRRQDAVRFLFPSDDAAKRNARCMVRRRTQICRAGEYHHSLRIREFFRLLAPNRGGRSLTRQVRTQPRAGTMGSVGSGGSKRLSW